MILITGATGLVGSHLLLKLTQKGNRVRALYRNKAGIEKTRKVFGYYMKDIEPAFRLIEWTEGDLMQPESLQKAMQGVEDVYHAAAVISFHMRDKELINKVNIQGTTHMVNMALQEGIKRFAYISSIATLGRMDTEGIVTEDTHWKASRKNSNYAISKYRAEMEVWRAHAEGLNVAVVNPSIILGPGFWGHGSSELFKLVANRLVFYTTGMTGFVDVRDVVDALVFLMDQNHLNDRFIVSEGNYTYQEVFQMMAQALGVPPPRIRVRPWMAEFAWVYYGVKGMLTATMPAITRETSRNSLNTYSFSNEKIKDLGFKFRPIRQTIETCAAHFKADHSG